MDRTPSRSRRAVCSLAVLGLALATAATAMAVDVRGRVRFGSDYGRTAPEAPDDARRNHYWSQWNGFLEPRPRGFDAARDLAVVLTGEGDFAEGQPGFRLANGGLWPTTMVARAGTTVEVQNTDPVSHELTVEGLAGFAETPVAPGRVRPIEVPSAGVHAIGDRLYAHVRGHLHVIDDLVARATVTADGSYHFTNVPPGTYTLKVFHGAEVVHAREGVVVEERELTIEPFPIGGAEGQ
ncbi:MAG: hypothetical protein KF729_36165 [Sandaracinaceae bacterium]|nr:hypothetical protein [Sandaracinaceae bacterium]